MVDKPKETNTKTDKKYSAEALNLCAEKLLELLEGDGRQVMLDMAAQYHVDPWMQVVGVLQRSLDLGWHTSPAISFLWTDARPIVDSKLYNAKCEVCQNEFSPRWPGQRFCSSICGSKYDISSRDARAVEEATKQSLRTDQGAKLSNEVHIRDEQAPVGLDTSREGGAFNAAAVLD